MIIKEITVNNYGPFAKPTLIKFEPGVTIFTGKNDTGKTSVLRLLNMIWTTGIITEDEANIDRTIISNVAWTKDTEVGCKMQIQGTALSKKYFEFPEAKEDSIIDVSFRFSPESPYKMIDGVTTTQKRININRKFLKSPSILFNSSDSVQINPVINLENPNEIEEKLLLLAFGRNPYDKLINISTWKLDNILENGSLQLNTALRRIIPKGLKYEIKFHKSVGVDFFGLTLSLRDQHSSSTPIHLRGAGLRKLLHIACLLLDRNFENEFVYILIDEPENSLHADAQHSFRAFLEELGKNQNLQIMYATHSPAMINPLHGDAVRLLEREFIDGVPTTVVNNNPYTNNYLPIRSSLGMTLADTLMYGPVTVISEGQTEVRCLPVILERMMKELPDKYSYLEYVLSQLFILDGQGDSFNYWSSIVKQQGSEPIIFVDGDKSKRVEQEQKAGKLKNIPVISLGKDEEFEQLIPIEFYFDALKEKTRVDEIRLEDFRDWASKSGIHPKMMLSKQIDRWLQDKYPDVYYDKPGTMCLALKMCELSVIKLDKIKELVELMEKLITS